MDNIFNVGDVVLVHKPSNVREPPSWNEYMDRFDGNEYPVLEVDRDINGIHVKLEDDMSWWFNVKWVELVNNEETVELDDDDLTDFIGGFYK